VPRCRESLDDHNHTRTFASKKKNRQGKKRRRKEKKRRVPEVCARENSAVVVVGKLGCSALSQPRTTL